MDTKAPEETFSEKRARVVSLFPEYARLGRERRPDVDLEAESSRPREYRAAMLNLLEDTVEARDRAEVLNRELQQRQAWLRVQSQSLEAAVNGADLPEALGLLVRGVAETLGPGTRAAFYLGDGATLHQVVGQPEDSANPVDDSPPGPESLAFPLAFHSAERILSTDVRTDPRWEKWQAQAEHHQYRAYWSFPITSALGKLVGSLAIYSDRPREATPRDLELATLLTNTASIIIFGHTESQVRRRAQEEMERHRNRLLAALEETERARAEAESAGRAKDQFLAILSHELRTPLTPVFIATRTLLRREDLTPDVREGLVMIQRNVGIEARMIDELLDLTRIAHGKLELHRERMDAIATLRHALNVAAPDLEAKEQKLIVELAPPTAFIQGDPMRLEQAFWNVLKNASKFTPEKGEIRVESKIDHDHIVIAISDTGKGIPSEALARIFAPFVQADDTIAREYGGLGLGLALAHATVDALGGSITAQSEGPNRGATFTIRLALA